MQVYYKQTSKNLSDLYNSRARSDASTLLSSKHPPALRSLGEGRVEEFLRALEDILLAHFQFLPMGTQ